MIADSQSAEQTQPPGEAAPATSHSSWWQFSLRTFFILVTLLVIALAWFVNGPEKQRRAVAVLREAGVRLQYDGYLSGTPPREGWVPVDYYLSVHEVDLLGLQSTDELIDQVLAVPNVKWVLVKDCDISERGISGLATHSSIEGLILVRSNFDSAPFKIELPPCHLDDGCLAHLEKLPRLHQLLLWGRNLTDKSLVYVGKLRRLKSLTLLDDWVSDSGLKHLADLKSLEQLSLTNTGIQGTGLIHLAGMESLRELNLARTLVGDEHLHHLRSLRSLESLCLAHTRVTDAGLDKLLQLPRLKILDLKGSLVSEAGLARVKGVLTARTQETIAASDAGANQR